MDEVIAQFDRIGYTTVLLSCCMQFFQKLCLIISWVRSNDLRKYKGKKEKGKVMKIGLHAHTCYTSKIYLKNIFYLTKCTSNLNISGSP